MPPIITPRLNAGMLIALMALLMSILLLPQRPVGATEDFFNDSGEASPNSPSSQAVPGRGFGGTRADSAQASLDPKQETLRNEGDIDRSTSSRDSDGARTLVTARRIIIDPGHGGTNLGALGITGLYEKYITLELAFRLKDRLEELYPGLEVLLTRETDRDIGLRERIQYSNRLEADLFISIHLNAAEAVQANGIETYFLSAEEPSLEEYGRPIAGNDEALPHILDGLAMQAAHNDSAVLAELIQGHLIEATGALDRGVKQGKFTVLGGAHMPAVVIELGFLSHDSEGRRVLSPDYQVLLVDALIEGIEDFDALLTEREHRR